MGALDTSGRPGGWPDTERDALEPTRFVLPLTAGYSMGFLDTLFANINFITNVVSVRPTPWGPGHGAACPRRRRVPFRVANGAGPTRGRQLDKVSG